MKRKAFKLGIGSLLLLTLLAIAAFLLKGGNQLGVAAELSPTPTAFVPQTPSLWENVSLEQVHFGPPRVVLTDTLGLRIVGWISNNEVIILRDTLPGGHGVAIEVFNAETQQVRRLAKSLAGGPVWNPAQQAIIYLQYDEVRGQRDLIWYSLKTGETQKLASDVTLPIVLVDGGKGAVAYSVSEKALVGRSVDLETQKKRFPFAQYAMRIPTPYEWIYHTAVSPDGKWQVVYNCEHFLLVNTEDGTIKELNLGTEVSEGKPFPRWALDAQWSQDRKQLAVASTFGDTLPRITQLLILDPWREKILEIKRPPGTIFSEVDWAPQGRYLLVSGLEAMGEGIFLPRMWLVDVKMGRIRELNLPVARGEDPRGGAAWSPDGKHLVFCCRLKSTSGPALCLTSVEVEQ